MLKRQRPLTPPIPSVPLIAPTPLDVMMMERESKRRRTNSTSDELSRDSWHYTTCSMVSNAKEDTSGCASSDSSASEYKSANNMLRELHTLHQHRLLFAPTTPSMLHTHGDSLQSPDIPPSSLKHVISSLPDPMRLITRASSNDPEATPSLIDEQAQVMEHYEETNRLLGSLFLSRRRNLALTDACQQ
ncbi:hypothetical protein AMATHDRAFT_3712 [Amanita thiersii Skay4041]|uniref:Uncharacterized protein n=1 Tax=Amanita thiersii Skay4041 TaxID=703135 RepID=A0A2A9NJH9_9AGAR|nr:hypothetical protein AMATHDRAFT_3712 [Amanita thiersii Skay4041]